MEESVSDWLRRVSIVLTGLLATHIGNEEDDSKHDAKGADDDVADSEEVVGATEHVRRREHEVLAASE